MHILCPSVFGLFGRIPANMAVVYQCGCDHQSVCGRAVSGGGGNIYGGKC